MNAMKEVDAFSYSVSHDLQAPLRHMKGFVELMKKRLVDLPDEKLHFYANAIAAASIKMQLLIDDLLAFSRMGHTELVKSRIKADTMVREVVLEMQDEVKGREIKIGCKDEKDNFTCSIADNGVGFDMKYVDRILGVFQRLHTQEELEGTGVGLANVRRIISRHGGKTWAGGSVGQGATFYFTIPKNGGREV